MPETTQRMVADDGARIYVEAIGDAAMPALIFSNSLGSRLEMWDAQAAALARDFFIIRYDARGHGRSDAPSGPYDMARLGRDALGILDALDVRKANWCGLSLGGMVGMWVATNFPDRIDRLVLANTAAHLPTAEMWTDRAKLVREQGLESLVAPTMGRWFTDAFREREPEQVARFSEMVRANHAEGYAASCEAIGGMDQRETIKAIRCPTLVIAGAQDPSTPPAMAEVIRDSIDGAELVVLDAAHLSNAEVPDGFTAALRGFLRT